jgi:glycine cleavage system H protein
MSIPKELRYTKEHEWLRKEQDGTMTVGITDYAQKELGDIVYVEIETAQQTLQKDEVFGAIEAVKTVSDLFLPVSGEILEVNQKIISQAELVNTDPYGEGWLIRINANNEAEIEDLLSAEEYEKLIG